MRWSISLVSPAVVAAEPVELSLGPDGEGRSAKVRIARDGDEVEFRVVAAGLDAAVRPAHPEWYNRAHLVVALNPGHDHATRWLYGVDDAGAVNARASWTVPGEDPGEAVEFPLEPAPAGRGSFEVIDGRHFRASLRLPASAVWPDAADLTGLAVKVGFHEECIPRPLRWPTTMAWTGDAPLGFGDLYRTPPAVAVETIDLPAPAFAEPAEMTLRAALGDGAPRSGQVRVRTVLPGDSEQVSDPVAWRAEAGRLEARPAVRFDHRGKWGPEWQATGWVEVTVADEAGAALWTGRFPFAFDMGIVVRERYGPGGGGALPPRPPPGDPEFIEKFRRYVLARLPDYRPARTADGAASDFYLVDPAGRADLDLSSTDWPERLAAMLAGRFDRWDDALAALAMWIYHPCITRHSSPWARVAGRVTVRSIPRLGGCFCGDTARLGAMLAERIGRRTGVALRGYSMGLRGHLATLVETPVGRVVIDGMVGLWFHALDNTRLATLEEMRADRRVVDRMWYSPRRHGHEFFFGNCEQIIRRWPPGELEFPPPAPR